MRGECFDIKMKGSFHFNRQLKGAGVCQLTPTAALRLLDRSGSVPFCKELGAVEGLADDACSLRRRVGPSRPDNLLHLGQDAGQVLVVMGDDGQVANPLI